MYFVHHEGERDRKSHASIRTEATRRVLWGMEGTQSAQLGTSPGHLDWDLLTGAGLCCPLMITTPALWMGWVVPLVCTR
jgi:hypothetical protein